MNTAQFERDERTGLWEWPVLLNGDWSQWTNEPCVILFGQTQDWGSEETALLLPKIGQLLLSRDWPSLVPFRSGFGSFVVLAPCYSPEQALLLAQHINRELSQVQVQPPSHYQGPRDATLTWGIAIAENPSWNLPRALQAAIIPVERALREMRPGSISYAPIGWEMEERDVFRVGWGVDQLTQLKSWSGTAALCSNYKDEPIALLMGDIDHFKTYNECLGHGFGDVMLQMMTHVLRRFESSNVVTFRLRSDVFLIWARGHSLERAKELAQQINTQVGELQIPCGEGDRTIEGVSLTWGVVGGSPREVQLHHLLSKAQELLNHAKVEQRGSVKAQRL